MSFEWGPERTALDEVIAEHKTWMENYLWVPESDWVLHKWTADIHDLLLSDSLFNKISGYSGPPSREPLVDRVTKDITEATLAPGSKWAYRIKVKWEGRAATSVDLGWSECVSVAGFSILKAGVRAIFIRREYISGPGSENPSLFTYIITSSHDSGRLRQYLKDILNSPEKRNYQIYTYDAENSGSLIVDSSRGTFQNWENLVLDDSVSCLVQRDVETFFKRKDWFLKNNIPFRRGYLLHGPPGNGKTSVIKTVLSSLGMNAYKIRLFSQNVTDSTLEKMFKEAQLSGPNVVILEDLDRAFPKTGERKSPIGLHTLLNCLDGLESQEGVITIATANEPTALDKAILKRPGRFDRVVLFDNPNDVLRLNYFKKKAPYLTEEELSPAVDATQSFSFAQLQETYVLAGQYAYEKGSETVSALDLSACASELRGSSNTPAQSADKFGFK